MLRCEEEWQLEHHVRGGDAGESANELRGNQRWTVREISGGHGMNRTNPDGLTRLFLELFPSREAVGVQS